MIDHLSMVQTALILQNRFLISALLDKKVVSLHWILKSNEF